MNVLLLAAGFGTRLRPITDHIPKCLVPIHNQPLLGYWLKLLCTSNQVDKILINTHYLPDAVRDFVATSPWRKRITLVHESELLGTGGTILKNQAFFQEKSFLVAHADNLTRFNIDEFIATHAKRPPGIEITMMTFDTDMPQSCGIVTLDQNDVVTHFYEKSPEFHGTKANAAVYIFDASVIAFLASLNKKIIDISVEVLPFYINKIKTYHNENYHRDIGTPQSLRLAEMEF